MIKITTTQLEQIACHGETTYPQECCGLLLGIFHLNEKIVLEVREAENVWTLEKAKDLPEIDNLSHKNLSKKNRFSIAPEVLLQVQKEARDRQIYILGVYHSHPNYPATPSEFDRTIAWSEYSYLIVSVIQGKATDYKVWKLDNNHQFQPETIQMIL